jgi:YbgC/YbaW family acyl-CoA thioester hydrolase
MTASISLRRRVQWMDTDAAGIWHHSVIIRWAEEAEAELHRRLGIIDETFGATPRVRTEFEFGVPVSFDDIVDISLTVTDLGQTSVTYLIEVTSDSRQIATGRMVAVLIDRESGEKRRWPDEIRQVLSPAP